MHTGSQGEVPTVVLTIWKTKKILPLIVACLIALASVVCLVHTDVSDDAPGAHEGHRHASSSSSTHSTLDVHCLIATLPADVILAWFSLSMVYVLTRSSIPLVPSFPPFIPPKTLVRV